ncbi:MAG: hypothetical protein EBZ48_04680, partial [Proteobacteria bacterium]|nr:hypothetical protein [Pseudomonadota bacterium]
HITQTQIDEPRGLTFPVGLRAVVRQDPDVLMVGEVRDRESAQIALQAALTGHLLLTSVHAGTIPGIVKRLRSMGIEDELLAESAPLFVNQRLIPTLCQRCKVVDLSASRGAANPRFRAVGCGTCDYSGFGGRVPIAQVWSPSSREMLAFDEREPISHSSSWIGWIEQIRCLLAAGTVAVESVAGFLE